MKRKKNLPYWSFALLLFSLALILGGCCTPFAHLDARINPPFLSAGLGESPGNVNSIVEADIIWPRLSIGLGPLFGKSRGKTHPCKKHRPCEAHKEDNKLDSLEGRMEKIEIYIKTD